MHAPPVREDDGALDLVGHEAGPLVVPKVKQVVAPAGAVPVRVRLREVVLGGQNVVDDNLRPMRKRGGGGMG